MKRGRFHMKISKFVRGIAILVFGLFTAASSPAQPPTLQELTARTFTNASIVWQATDNLPKTFWVYRRVLPKVFSTSVLTRAMVLAGMQNRGIPKPSTNTFFIAEDHAPDYPGPIFTVFEIDPGNATISYCLPEHSTVPASDLPSNETVVAQGKKYASEFGLDAAKMLQRPVFSETREIEHGETSINTIRGRGVFLARQLDGTTFFSMRDNGEGAEGFSIVFGTHNQLGSFNICWSDVVRYSNQVSANQSEIIGFIHTHRIIVLPDNEENYFADLKSLAATRKLTIKKMTTFYGDGIFGEVPKNDEPSRFITPFIELDCDAQINNSNMLVRMLSPVISPEYMHSLAK